MGKSTTVGTLPGLVMIGVAVWAMAKCSSDNPAPHPRATTVPVVPGTAAVPSAPGQAWREATSTSPIDDSTTVQLTLASLDTVKAWPGRTHRPELVIRCKENKTDAIVITGSRLQPELGKYNKATVTVRVDDQKAYQVAMNESTDGEALFFPQPIGHIKRFLTADQLLVQFVPFNSPPSAVRFRVKGLDQRIAKLRKTCGW